MYICIYLYVCLYVCIYVYLHVYMCEYMHVCVLCANIALLLDDSEEDSKLLSVSAGNNVFSLVLRDEGINFIEITGYFNFNHIITIFSCIYYFYRLLLS